MNLLQALDNFKEATRILEEVWDTATKYELKILNKEYRFKQDFFDLSVDIRNFCEDVEEKLLIEAPVEYAICRDPIYSFGQNHWVQARVYKEGNLANVVDELGREASITMTYEDYERCFFKIPKEMYDFWLRLNNDVMIDEIFDLIDLANKIYNKEVN